MPDGSVRPVAYAARSLNPAERNYPHLDKQGVAVIFGVKKFHQYLYGRLFTINTDHKPPLGLFSEFRTVPQMGFFPFTALELNVVRVSVQVSLPSRSGKR